MFALLALLSSVVWGTSDFVAGLKARTLAPLAVVGYSQLVGFAALSLVVLLGHPLGSGPWVGWSLAAGVCGAIALAAFYSALAAGTMSVVAPIASLGAAVPVLLGVVTGETPSAIAWVGMGVAVLGTVMASGPEIQAGLSVRPVALACVAAVGFGFVLFCMDRGSRVSLLSTLWGMRLTSLVLYAGLAALRRSTGGIGRRDWPVLLFVGVADLGANILFVSASTRGMVSIAAVLGSPLPGDDDPARPSLPQRTAAVGTERRRGPGASRCRGHRDRLSSHPAGPARTQPDPRGQRLDPGRV